jgi:hypothetical protein
MNPKVRAILDGIGAVMNRSPKGVDAGSWLLMSVLGFQIAAFAISAGSAAISLPLGWLLAFGAGVARYPFFRDIVLLSVRMPVWKLVPAALLIFIFSVFLWSIYRHLDVVLVQGLRAFFPCAAISDLAAWMVGAIAGCHGFFTFRLVCATDVEPQQTPLSRTTKGAVESLAS